MKMMVMMMTKTYIEDDGADDNGNDTMIAHGPDEE